MDIFHSKIYLLAVLLSHVYISRLFCLLGSIFFSQDASYFIKYHLIYERVRFSSSSETKGQSVGSGEKAERKFSSAGERAPGYRLSPSYVQNFKRMPDPNWAQKLLCIVVPNRRKKLSNCRCVRTTVTATKTPFKSRAASSFIALILFCSFRQLLTIFSGVEFWKTVSIGPFIRGKIRRVLHRKRLK